MSYGCEPNLPISTPLPGLAELERQAIQFGQRTAQHALQNSLRCWIEGHDWPTHVSTAEGVIYRKRRRSLTLNSAAGPVEIGVPSYEAVGHESLRPVELALGLDHSVTPLAQLRCAELASHLPFKLSTKLLTDLTPLEISPSTVRHVAQELGQAARIEQLEAAPPADFGPVTKAEVQIDGGKGHVREEWREARVARVELTNASGEKWVTALTCIACAALFWSRLQPLLKRLLADSPRAVLGFIGDGAPWILYRALALFPHAIGVLDLYHLKLHLHEMANVVWGKGSDAAKYWVRQQVRWLKRGRSIATWLENLEALYDLQTREAARQAVAALYDYVHPRQHLLRYRKARRLKLPIGSGRIESWIKQLLTLRIKRPGCRWSDVGAARMLALRAAAITGRLRELWAKRLALRTAQLRTLPQPLHDIIERAPQMKLLTACPPSIYRAA